MMLLAYSFNFDSMLLSKSLGIRPDAAKSNVSLLPEPSVGGPLAVNSDSFD